MKQWIPAFAGMTEKAAQWVNDLKNDPEKLMLKRPIK
jgi:hypothetical protein